jgi:eukaryotic-like serine/threonine-protein kinase
MPRAASASSVNPPPTSGSSSSTLSPGTRFGSYEILQRLGAGGMGEVYRARDSRLDREVAIKTLSFDRGSQPEALSRFEQEARSASSLNHPNIVTIYELGQENGTHYIAMELVDGKRCVHCSTPARFHFAN